MCLSSLYVLKTQDRNHHLHLWHDQCIGNTFHASDYFRVNWSRWIVVLNDSFIILDNFFRNLNAVIFSRKYDAKYCHSIYYLHQSKNQSLFLRFFFKFEALRLIYLLSLLNTPQFGKVWFAYVICLLFLSWWWCCCFWCCYHKNDVCLSVCVCTHWHILCGWIFHGFEPIQPNRLMFDNWSERSTVIYCIT